MVWSYARLCCILINIDVITLINSKRVQFALISNIMEIFKFHHVEENGKLFNVSCTG